jgi:transposase InsO family protein
VLARRHGINPKTVAKWKKRPSVQDERTGPKEPRSTVLTLDEEAILVAFRRHTLLPLDDCLYALQATIPHLTRSSLHRCLKRHGLSRLPNTDGDKPRRAKFKRYPIGYFHIDLAEVRTEQGKLYLLVAIDRTSKFAFVELHERVTRRVAANFLRALIAAVPYRVHTVLTDNGTHFTEPSGNTWAPDEIKQMLARKQLFRAHAFELACAQNDVAHRLTKPRHPWTNGQVERMNRTIKEATVQRFYDATHDQLRAHLADFVAAYNFARRLKTLKGLTPYEFICKRWTREPERFRLNPLHQMPAPNTYSVFRSGCIVSCGCEVVGAFGGCEDVDEAPDGGPKALNRTFGGFPEQSFEFGKRVLDGVEVGRVRREVEQACTRRLDQGSHACPLVAGQVVQDHDIARP